METATLTKNEEAHVERMAGAFTEPTMSERFNEWAARTISDAKREEKTAEGKHRLREVKLEDRSDEEKKFIEAVGQKDESEKESPAKSSAERQATEHNERPDAKARQGKWTQAEANDHWRQISASASPAWQKASPQFIQEYTKALAEVENGKEVMEHFAAQPEGLHNVKTVGQLRSAVHAMSEVKQAVSRHPDAQAKIIAATNEITAKAPPYLQQMVNDSEVLGELLYVLADAATINKLLEAAKTNPGKAVRVLRDMETDISRALANEKAPSPRPRAPRPPTELPGRMAAAGDAGTRGETNFSSFSARQSQSYAR